MHKRRTEKHRLSTDDKAVQRGVLDNITKIDNRNIKKTEEDDFDNKLEKIMHVMIDKISIKDGDNEISIELTKKPTRVFEIKIRLNNCDIRPCTYTGKSSAMNYWELLKGQLK